LLAQLTPQEKLGQLTQYFFFGRAVVDDTDPEQAQWVDAALSRGEVGSLLFLRTADETNRMQRLAIEGNRLGIPVLFGFDVIHGLRTVFPVPIALAASWDSVLIERVQGVAAREARAVGIHWSFAPMVDIARDPRWGRMVEGAGEDPLLASVVAAAQVRGLQGGKTVTDGHVLAGPKHFAGYGAALGGRDYDESDISDQQLWNVYLPPFQAAIEAGAGSIMSAYMDLNGVPATGNAWLLIDVLRKTLGFTGFVVSDADAVRDLTTHHFVASLSDAGVVALNAGLDMEMAKVDAAMGHITPADVDIERLDESVRRILEVKEALGLFDRPFVDEDAAALILADPTHRDLARQAAESTAVLLRNKGVLPLRECDVKRLAVIGPMADSRRDTLGPWVFAYDIDETVTILAGLRARLDGHAEVAFAPGVGFDERTYPSFFADHGPSTPDGFDSEVESARAVDIAQAADVAVVVLGERQDMVGEYASRSSIELPGNQLCLLQAVVATGTPTVLVLLNGRPLDLRWADRNVSAILEAWYPGTRGGEAIANLLFGDASPAGKLPFTWPRTVGQVPLHYAATRGHDPNRQDTRYWDETSTPLYCFGHGLSYTRFEYSDLVVETPEVQRDGKAVVSVDVTNVSERAGVEVVQLYLHQRYGTSSRPLRELKAFERVELSAGQTKQVHLEIGPEGRRYWSAATRDWVLDSTRFDVWVGTDSQATLHAEFTVL